MVVVRLQFLNTGTTQQSGVLCLLGSHQMYYVTSIFISELNLLEPNLGKPALLCKAKRQ